MTDTKLYWITPNPNDRAVTREGKERTGVSCVTAARSESDARMNAAEYGRQYEIDWLGPAVGCLPVPCFGPMAPEGFTSFSEDKPHD
jgi:hypothetical protein